MSAYYKFGSKDTTLKLSNAFDGDVTSYVRSGCAPSFEDGCGAHGSNFLDGDYHWFIFELKVKKLQVVESVEIVPARAPGNWFLGKESELRCDIHELLNVFYSTETCRTLLVPMEIREYQLQPLFLQRRRQGRIVVLFLSSVRQKLQRVCFL